MSTMSHILNQSFVICKYTNTSTTCPESPLELSFFDLQIAGAYPVGDRKGNELIREIALKK